MSNHYAVIVSRGPAFDPAKGSREQDGYEPHAAHWRQLEESGFVAMAGLMHDSMEVLFIIRADSEEEIREKISGDAWQKAGQARITRITPIEIRFNPPPPFEG